MLSTCAGVRLNARPLASSGTMLEVVPALVVVAAMPWSRSVVPSTDSRKLEIAVVAATLFCAVMIVGGNIDGVTRVMTTAIALETSKGDLPLALALGLVLIALVVLLNAVASSIRALAVHRYG